MKTIEEQIAVMQHVAAGGKVEMQYADGAWKLNDTPQWERGIIDYRIAEEADPYAELKAAAKNPTKQIRYGAKGVWVEWIDANPPGGFSWCYPPEEYEIRDKPKPMKKVKLLAWFDGDQLFWLSETAQPKRPSKRVPDKDMEIEIEMEG